MMSSTPVRRSSNTMTVASTTRETQTGRVIRYDLSVIQQPERARACGSGAKSCADRRPVDPPPVVELRVFEKTAEKWEDITFGYGANFFLYTTLEVARPMAHGRVQQPSTPQTPVLTGMPVSGMAYLDRPREAGYFIFPDLSVRHEGMYILSFNLYEETRPDAEQDIKSTKPMSSSGMMSPDASFDWRLEIKSEMFQVYSAKKFPGLAESTSLSRIVAEQGCRVRIRRDVRMRRRDVKPNGEDTQEENYQSNRPNHHEDARRSRATNNGPEDGLRSGTHSPERPIAPTPEGGHMGFLKNAAPQPFATPRYAPQQQGQHQFAQPQPSYQQPQYAQWQAQPPNVHSGYGKEYPSSAIENRREPEMYQPDYRRQSYTMGQPPHPQQYHQPPPTADPNFRVAQLPPILRAEKRDSMVASSPLAPISLAAPWHSPANERTERSMPAPHQYLGPQLAPAPAPLTPSLPEEPMRNGRKRPHDNVFSSSSTTQPLHNGMRPGSSHGDNPMVDDDDEDVDNQIPMVYKRANGSDFGRMLAMQK